MEVVILAAGFGKGLEPVTHTRPKPLIPVLNKTLLEYHLDNLREVGGFSRVIVVSNYMIDKVRDLTKRVMDRYPFEIVVVDQGKPLGTGHSLLKGLEAARGEDILVIYVDVVYRVEDLRTIAKSQAPNIISAYRVGDPRDYGVLVLDSSGNLRDIVEKPSQPISNLINAGIYRFQSDISHFLEKIEVSPRGEYELTDAVRMMLSAQIPVVVHVLGYWRDVGRPWRYLEFVKDFLYESVYDENVLGKVEPGVRIRGPVYVDEDAEVLSGTYIAGPAYIGRNAVVGPNAFVRPGTAILTGARIGFSVEVKESVVMEYAHASHLSYIGDSIVCEHTNLGAGTILANLRLDGKEVKTRIKGSMISTGRTKFGAVIGGYSKTGVNVSINPGVKVGAYSRVFPGVVLYKDVPPCSIVRPDGSLSRIPREECYIDIEAWL